MIVAGAQPAEHLTDDPAAPADAETLAVVQEHGHGRAMLAGPQVAGLDGLAGDRAPSPRWGDAVAPRPSPARGVQTADAFQHERDEVRRVAAAFQDRIGALAQLPFGVLVQGLGSERGEPLKPRAVEQQSAMAEPFPSGQDTHDLMSTVRGVVEVSSSKLTQSLSNR